MANTNKTTKEIKKPKALKSLESVIYSQEGVKTGDLSLPKDVFGQKWNADLVHEVVTSMQSNKRAGIAHTKDRGEVSGGGKKPWKQKGTGRARHGSTRSPIWVGGGTTFGPRNDKDYSKKINKKTKVKALFTLLSKKYDLGNILFVESLALSEIKTKNAEAVMSTLSKIENFEKINSSKKTSTLLAVPEISETIAKSFANLPGVTVVKTTEVNVLDLMNFKHLIVVDPSTSIKVLESKKK